MSEIAFRIGDLLRNRITGEVGPIMRMVQPSDLPQPIQPQTQPSGMGYIVALAVNGKASAWEALWWESEVERPNSRGAPDAQPSRNY